MFGGPILLAPSNPAQIVGPGLGSSRRIKRLHVHSPVSPAEEEEEGGGRLAGFIARDKNGGGGEKAAALFSSYFSVINITTCQVLSGSTEKILSLSLLLLTVNEDTGWMRVAAV